MHLNIIEVSGLVHRAFHAVPPFERKSDGHPVEVIYGVVTMLWRLLRDERGHRAVIVFDDRARRTWRHERFAGYKAARKPLDDRLRRQLDPVRGAVSAFGLTAASVPGYEADDVIASYARAAREAGWSACVITSDKDMAQCVCNRVSLRDPLKMTTAWPDDIEAKFGIPPSLMVDMQALAGDAVDGIPGIPGVGTKTAAALLRQFGSLDAALERYAEAPGPRLQDKLLAFADQARMSRELARLVDDLPLPVPIDDVQPFEPIPRIVEAFCTGWGFGIAGQSIAAEMKPMKELTA